MKNKFLLSVIAMASMTINACGQFTNFPAQYHISDTSGLTATVAYPAPAAGSTATSGGVTVKLPRLVVKGEPGSVGANFEQMDVSYNVGDITASKSEISFRVNSSHFRDATDRVIVDGGSIDLPVISPKVIEYGRRQSASNISARVTLSGTDDAGWPTSFQVNVPIVFIPGGSAINTPSTP